MKLDVRSLRYMTREDFRVLTAVEMGMKNHDVVPTELIASIAGLRHGGAHKTLQNLLRYKLVYHDRKIYDGYRLTYGGYDYLALKTLLKRGVISGVGRQIGVGKESDIFIVIDDDGNQMALKLHRLGRVSFRAIKQKRDYLKHRKAASWLYMSRLAAMKEYAFMQALHAAGFPTPTPIEQNRHCVLMSLAKGYPLRSVTKLINPGPVYNQLIDIVVRLAQAGLIHCDFNEFNVMISDESEVTMIDFPQMVSTSHRNAKMYFERDAECVRAYFMRRYNFYPEDPLPTLASIGVATSRLDKDVEASGFTETEIEYDDAAYEELMEAQRDLPERDEGDEGDDDDSDDEEGGDETAGEDEAGGSGSGGGDGAATDGVAGAGAAHDAAAGAAEADAVAEAEAGADSADGVVRLAGSGDGDEGGDELFGVDAEAAATALAESAAKLGTTRRKGGDAAPATSAAAAAGGGADESKGREGAATGDAAAGDAAGGDAGGAGDGSDDGEADSDAEEADAGALLMEPSEPGPRFARRRGVGGGGRGRGRGGRPHGSRDAKEIQARVRNQLRRKEARSNHVKIGRNQVKNKEKRRLKAEINES